MECVAADETTISTDDMTPARSSGLWVGNMMRALTNVPERATTRDMHLHARLVHALCSLYAPDVTPLAFRAARPVEIARSRFTHPNTSAHVVILAKTLTRRWTDIMLASDASCPTWVECVDLNNCKFIRFMVWFVGQIERMYPLPHAFSSVFRDVVIAEHLLAYPESGKRPRIVPWQTDGAIIHDG